MLDMKLLRERTDFVRERLATRNAGDEAKVTEVLTLDESRRSALAEAEQLKARRNSASKEIGALIGQKRLEEAEGVRPGPVGHHLGDERHADGELPPTPSPVMKR